MSIGWDIDQFWDRTPYQLDLAIKAHSKRLDTQQSLLAWHAANLMNCWVKDKITPAKLMGKKTPQPVNLTGASKEDVKAYYRAKQSGEMFPELELMNPIKK